MATLLAAAPEQVTADAETYADFGEGTKGKCAYWKAEIHACNKEMDEWRERATKTVNRYRDDRKGQAFALTQKKYNMLWSIINTTMPAVYGKPPEPIVMRRFTDPDQVARVASLILERGLEFQLCSQRSFHAAIKGALQDRLLPGMGVVWVRFQKDESSPTNTITDDYYARLSGSVAAVDYVYWEDFGFVPSRVWEEVPAVWRIVYMTKDQLDKRFPGKKIPLDYTPARHPTATSSTQETDEPKHTVFKQARIYEIWDKRTSKVCWVSTGCDDLLDEKDDPMHFPGFFPCPKPLFATNTTGNLVPVPDYCMYQDQATEIDNLTQRLDMLVKACKVVGLYDSSQLGIERMLTEATDNQLIPVDTWAAFAEKGGIKGVIDFLPLDDILEVITRLFETRQQLIQDIYQITGLSDIIRGASNPNETLGAQKIKAQFASVRLDALKQDLARFATETLQLMGHVMVEFFDPQTLVDQSAIMQSPDGQKAVKDAQAAMQARMQTQMQQPSPLPQQAPPGGAPGGMLPAPGGNVLPMHPPMGPQAPAPDPATPGNIVGAAIELLKKGKQADYRIEIAADSLIEPDLEAAREASTAFITSITQFFQQALPAMQENPQMAPISKALLMFGIRNFRAGRDVEGIIDAAFSEMENNPAPPKPDPKMQAVQVKAQGDQAKMQGDMAMQQQKMQQEQQKMQSEFQLKVQEMQSQLQMERERNAGELQQMREKTAAEVQAILLKAGVTLEANRQKMTQQAESQAQSMTGEVISNAATMAQDQQAHEQNMSQQKDIFDQQAAQASETPSAA